MGGIDLKKIIGLILIFILLLSTFSFAQDLTPGEQLQALGLVTGDASGDLMEDKTLTRAEMMVMLARLNDLEDAAENFTAPSNFEDIEDHWAKPFITYAERMGWTRGVSETSFAPEQMVSEQEVATFMIRVLGYEDNYATAIEDAKRLGIENDNKNEEFTRGNAFDMMFDTINTPKNWSQDVLGVQLEVMDEEDVIKEDTERPKLMNVRAKNRPGDRDEIVLTFSEVMSSYSLNQSNLRNVLSTMAFDNDGEYPFVKTIDLMNVSTHWSDFNTVLTIQLDPGIILNDYKYVAVWIEESKISDLSGNKIQTIDQEEAMFSNRIY